MQTNENETIRVIFVGWLLVFDYAVGAADRIGDRVSTHAAQPSSPTTHNRSLLRDRIQV